MTFRYAHYIPRDTAGFFRYDGSLTTPGCTEGVLWTVFTNTLRISKTQVLFFNFFIFLNYNGVNNFAGEKFQEYEDERRQSIAEKLPITTGFE